MEFILSWEGLALMVPISVTLVLYLVQSAKTNLNEQLMDPQDRADIRATLQSNEPLQQYLSALDTFFLKPSQRFFGPPLSLHALLQCLNIAFVYPIVVLTIAWAAGAECSFGKDACPIPTNLPVGPERWWRASLLLASFAMAFAGGFFIARHRGLVAKIILGFLPISQETAEDDDSLISFTVDTVCWVLLLVALQQLLSHAILQPAFPLPSGGLLAAGAVGLSLCSVVGCAMGRQEFWFLPMVMAAVLVFDQIIDARYGTAIVVFVMGLALPTLNGLADWLSLYITRRLVSSMRAPGSALRSITGICLRVVSDFVVAFAMLAFLVAMTSLTIVALNHWILASVAGRDPIDLWRLVELARAAPLSEGFFVTFTLATTFFPTLAHLIAGIFGIAFTLSPKNSEAARLIPTDKEAHFSASNRQAVIRALMWRSIWVPPAILTSMGLLAGLFLIVGSLTAPVGQLLSDIAYCSTAWSHGICPSEPPSIASN